MNIEESKEYIAEGHQSYVFKVENWKIAEINGHQADIELIEAGDGELKLRVGSKLFTAELLQKNQNKYCLLINGNTYNITIETEISHNRKHLLPKNEMENDIIKIVSPMPGKIVDLLVAENSTVEIGQPLLILEAMKMQNEIRSTFSGTIQAIHVKQNDAVIHKQLLVEIKTSSI